VIEGRIAVTCDKTAMREALAIAVAVVAAATACHRTAAPASTSAADAYRAEIAAFRHAKEATLTSDTGWLTIAGLFFLTEPETTFGSDPKSDIVLRAGAPPHAGTFSLKDGHVRVQAASGVTFTLNGKPFTSGEIASDGASDPDRLVLGDLQLWVHQSGERLAIRLRDRNSRLRKDFTGMKFFPVDAKYRVDAQYVPYDKPLVVQIPNILGDVDTMTSPGYVTFSLGGQALKMVAVQENDHELWFIFRDETSGAETDAAARFLYSPLPVDGRVVLDFNRAENPPCAYTPYATCPLPPKDNRLTVRIEAGERLYAAAGDP
jgi:uncharacterized protein